MVYIWRHSHGDTHYLPRRFDRIGAIDFIRAKSFDNFTVAGRSQNTASVTFSMLATIIGGSATTGLIERAYNIGFPAFWWLAVGSVGLLLQAIVLSKRVRELGLYTLPDVVELTMGKTAQVIASIIIIVSWIGILAAHFAASAKILAVYLPSVPLNAIVAACAAAVIVYTAMGGQFSVLKTDFVQFIFIAVSVVVALACLFADCFRKRCDREDRAFQREVRHLSVDTPVDHRRRVLLHRAGYVLEAVHFQGREGSPEVFVPFGRDTALNGSPDRAYRGRLEERHSPGGGERYHSRDHGEIAEIRRDTVLVRSVVCNFIVGRYPASDARCYRGA